MSKTKKPSRASRRAAPRCSAELYVQHDRFCADRWRVMLRVGQFETYAIGAECVVEDHAHRLRHDFHEALTKLGVKLPNKGVTGDAGGDVQ